jgi:PIN domain nuclease of toxin-antitoxin system
MYVTDTAPLVHYASAKKAKLGRDARRIFEQAEAGNTIVYIPTVCLWETVQLIEAGEIRLDQRFDSWCRWLAASRTFIITPLEWEDVNEARSLRFTSDPFDRFIVGTAKRLDIPLITSDRVITEANVVEVVW